MIRKDLGHKHAMHLDVLEEIINQSRDTYYQQNTMTRKKYSLDLQKTHGWLLLWLNWTKHIGK